MNKTIVLNLTFAVTIAVSLCSCWGDDCKKIQSMWKENYELEKKNLSNSLSLDVYVENSGSIDGYVTDMNSFKTDIYALISNAVVDNSNLYYINSIILPQNKNPRDFILNLTPSSFKNLGGNRKSTDIADVIEKSTKNATKKPVLLASDFILSPDKAHIDDVASYFDIQKNDINQTFSKLLKQDKNIAVVVFQGIGDFNGYYWNKYEQVSKIKEPRPFYVMLAGSKQKLALLINKTRRTTHFKHAYSEFTPSTINYGILSDKKYKVGNFRPCKNSNKHIEKIQTERRSDDFEFAVGVNYSNLPLNEIYLLDKNNYSLSDNSYVIKEIKVNTEKSLDYTHIITFASTKKKPSPANLEVKLKKLFPNWISESQDSSGMKAERNKTFGIKPLMEGIQLAYAELKKNQDYYTKFEIILEK